MRRSRMQNNEKRQDATAMRNNRTIHGTFTVHHYN
jgi:hypothetical protein